MLNQLYVDNIIKTALCEDINYIDVTPDNLLDDDHKSNAYFVAKDSGYFFPAFPIFLIQWIFY